MIDWKSAETHWPVSPKLSAAEQNRFAIAKASAPKIPASIWIRSSGSTAQNSTRWLCLSKARFLIAAAGANTHLQASSSDVWLRCLPTFHVGGLAILARAHLSRSKVVELSEWSPDKFVETVQRHRLTLASLVPTQVYDLVRLNLQCPKSLRAVVVGGDALDSSLYHKARILGWPLLPSYGSTEMGSQVATASLKSLIRIEYPDLELLPHVHARVDAENRLHLRSEALFVGELSIDEKNQVRWWPQPDGEEFVTSDRVQIDGRRLQFLGRSQDLVKVMGELVSMVKLREIWHELLIQNGESLERSTLVAISHPRNGHEIVLACELGTLCRLKDWTHVFNQRVEKYEKIQALYGLEQIPLTDLGKIRFAELLQKIQRESLDD